MLFSSLIFIFLFLPLALIAHFFLKGWRNEVLFFASLVFYAWGEPAFVAVLFLSILINYFAGLSLFRFKLKKTLLGIATLLNLALLFYFKYITFLLTQISALFAKIGFIPFEVPRVWLPIGISFFTFQGVSYLVDIYRKEISPQRNFIDFGMYLALFPQLIAGPIVRYQSIQGQIKDRSIKAEDLNAGLKIFISGLAAKVLLANPLGAIADAAFADTDNLSLPFAWAGLICYTLQIYFDFSGYSQMAIGLGKCLGFEFPINFNFPYIAKSITEFWRRWHISLSTWFRDYVYIPLGGNRKGLNKTLRNLLLVFLATGFWHGANWTFLAWGLWHGLFLILERVLKNKTHIREKLKTNHYLYILRHIYALLVIMLGWALFRSTSIEDAWRFTGKLFNFQNSFLSPRFLEICDPFNLCVFNIALICCLPLAIKPIQNTLNQNAIISDIVYLFLFVLSVIALYSSDFNPFLYFRF